MSDTKNIQQFWDWFSANNSRFLFITDVSEQEREIFMNELVQHLHNYCGQLYFQVGGQPGNKKMELIISAEGLAEYFPKVEALVDAAPAYDNWAIVKFKQPQGPELVAQYGGRDFDPKKTMYIPLHNKNKPNAIGIHVCYPDYSEEEKSLFVGGTYLMLDTILGEKSTTLDIEYMDVIKTPANITEMGFGYLSVLKEYVDKIKGRSNLS